jgi:hypothetical protein
MSVPLKDHLSDDFENVFANALNHDVELIVGQEPNKETIKAHSPILCGRSMYFRRELLSTRVVRSCGRLILFIPDITVDVMKCILR